MLIKSEAYIEKATKLKEGEIEFIVSTNALDAHGERIDVNGIDLKDYKKNPVVLFGHDAWNLPIARTKKIWLDGKKLMAVAEFYLKDEFANKVYNYIVDGFLKAVSIGGMVEQWGEDGMTIKRMNMKEFSVVTIPANPEAMVSQKSLTEDQVSELKGLANRYARKMLAQDSNKLLDDISTLETLVASLKDLASGESQEDKASEITSTKVVLEQARVVDNQVERIIVKLKGKNNE